MASTTKTASTTAPCLITPNNDNNDDMMNRKRKRSRKSVRFDVDQNVIIDTYSPMDYDRGSVFSFPPVLYKINPIILEKNNNQQPSLSLEIPSSPCDSEDSSPETESCDIPLINTPLNTTFTLPNTTATTTTTTTTTTTNTNTNTNTTTATINTTSNTHNTNINNSNNNNNNNKKKKPKLSVDTSICAGPLFFTNLSTNHVRHKVNDSASQNDEDDSKNDYLVPISAI